MTKPKATKAPAAEKKTRGRQAGSKNKSTQEKGAALALIDFFGGNITRAARSSGIPVRTLATWQAEIENSGPDATALQTARVEADNSVLSVLERFLEAVMAIALMKAVNAPFKEIYYALGIMFDKMEKMLIVFNTQRQILYAQQSVLNSGVPETAGLLMAAPDPKAQWEAMVDQILSEAKEQDIELTREQAIANLIKLRPQAKEYLM